MNISVSDYVIFAGLLLASALFSGSESALMAINRLRIRALADKGNRTAALIDHMLDNRSRLISTLLIGNNIVNVALTAFATVVFTGAFSGLDAAVSASLAAMVSVVFLLVFGEVLPKTVGVNMPLRVSLIVAWPVYGVCLVLAPISVLMAGLQRFILRMVGHEPGDDLAVTGADLKTMARLAGEQDIVGAHSGEAIANLVDFHEIRVREVMTPRTEMVAVPADASYADVTAVLREHFVSRLPVYTTDLDDIVGVLNARDLIGLTLDEQAAFRPDTLMRHTVFVPELKRADAMILEMRRNKFHLAIVVDEYGGTAGLVTLEDLLEEVVGQIEDEYDAETPKIRRIREGVLLADAACPIADVERVLKTDLDGVESVDTLAGLFLREYGKIPSEGDRISLKDVDITVHRMDGQRIHRLMLRQRGVAGSARRGRGETATLPVHGAAGNGGHAPTG